MAGINRNMLRRNILNNNMQMSVKNNSKTTAAKEVKATEITSKNISDSQKPTGITTTEKVVTGGTTELKAPYRGGNWGKGVQRDLASGRLHAGDHINVVSGGRMYRFQIVDNGNGNFTARQVNFYNGANSVAW